MPYLSGMNRFFRYRIDQVLFWVLTIGFHAFTSRTVLITLGIDYYLMQVLVRNGLLALLIYGNLLLIFPLFYNHKRIVPGALLVLFSLILYTALKCLDEYFVLMSFPEELLSSFKKEQLLSGYALRYSLYYNFSIALFYLGFATALHLSKQWYVQRETLRQIRIEKLNTELDYLKAQMNPHFLFNSLNTIFFQIHKENTEARETLGKFSDMLRYQLYECNAETIPIEKEVMYLKNYVALQQLRKDEHYSIDFQIDPLLKGFSIPPLLLIPFIENAFKHVSNYADKPNVIQIILRKHGETFELEVNNTTEANNLNESGGIGLKNVKRRLELLYPGNHWLTAEQREDQFCVILKFRIT